MLCRSGTRCPIERVPCLQSQTAPVSHAGARDGPASTVLPDSGSGSHRAPCTVPPGCVRCAHDGTGRIGAAWAWMGGDRVRGCQRWARATEHSPHGSLAEAERFARVGELSAGSIGSPASTSRSTSRPVIMAGIRRAWTEAAGWSHRVPRRGPRRRDPAPAQEDPAPDPGRAHPAGTSTSSSCSSSCPSSIVISDIA